MAFFEEVNNFRDQVRLGDGVRIFFDNSDLPSFSGSVLYLSGSREPAWLEDLVEKGQLDPGELDVVLTAFDVKVHPDRIEPGLARRMGLVGMSLQERTLSGMKIRGYETNRSEPYNGW